MKQVISGYTKLAAVVANPIKHSLSPMIHNAAYELLNYDAVYLAFDVGKDDFPSVMESVKTLDMLGINISMPYKKEAFDLCHTVSREAELIGVVNTVVQENGILTGYNTDGIGFVRSLNEQDVSVENKKITILGAGGAAKAIICQCALDAALEINVFKRKNDTFELVQKELQEIKEKTNVPIYLHDYHNQTMLDAVLKKSDIIVNGTHIGMGEDKALPIPNPSVIDENHVVVDLIYYPLETAFLKEAKRKKAKTINGLGMLLYQAAEAFKLMTDKKMPTKEVELILTKELNEKRG